MMPRHADSRVWFSVLFAGFLMQASLAAGQEPPLPRQPHLTADTRSRLLDGARDSTIALWQREFMLEVARGNTVGDAAKPSPAPARVTADDGAWIVVPPPCKRTDHTAIYDPVRDRMVVFGGNSNHLNDVWALSLGATPAWSLLTPTGTPPTARSGHSAIYDPVRDRMVVFGGFDGAQRNDVWALSFAGGATAWSVLAPAGLLPAPRTWHTAVYDRVRDRMLVFGGLNSTFNGVFNDVWALSLAGSTAWTQLTPGGTLPAGRYYHTAIYDPVRDRMVVFGGLDLASYFSDLWALSLGGSPSWSALTLTGGPVVRAAHSAIYDPVRDRMVIFGGVNGAGRVSDSWALSFSGSPAWTQLLPAGTLPQMSDSRTGIYDPVNDRVMVFGGNSALTGDVFEGLWALSFAGTPSWSPVDPAGMIPVRARAEHTAIYDPVRDRMVVFGGGYLNNALALSLAGIPTWSALTPAETLPAKRTRHTAIYDPVRDRMVVFGGSDTTTAALNDVWALSLSGSPAWTQLVPTGPLPAARSEHTAIYDPVRDRMVVFGGIGSGTFPIPVPLNDVWTLSLAGSPAWTQLVPSGTLPVGRTRHTAIYDPVRDRMVAFGGSSSTVDLNDVWALALAGSPMWTKLAPAGTLPAVRAEHTAIYDPVRDRMVVFGGDSNHGKEVWALSLAGGTAWSALASAGTLPNNFLGHTAIYDPVRDRMVAYGTFTENPVWALRWTPSLSVPGDGVSRLFELAPPQPNPSRGETTVEFDLGAPGRVVLDVFDAQGRRVKRIADEWFAAGRHTSAWRGDDERGHALGSGVYFIRMQVGRVEVTRHTVRVR